MTVINSQRMFSRVLSGAVVFIGSGTVLHMYVSSCSSTREDLQYIPESAVCCVILIRTDNRKWRHLAYGSLEAKRHHQSSDIQGNWIGRGSRDTAILIYIYIIYISMSWIAPYLSLFSTFKMKSIDIHLEIKPCSHQLS